MLIELDNHPSVLSKPIKCETCNNSSLAKELLCQDLLIKRRRLEKNHQNTCKMTFRLQLTAIYQIDVQRDLKILSSEWVYIHTVRGNAGFHKKKRHLWLFIKNEIWYGWWLCQHLVLIPVSITSWSHCTMFEINMYVMPQKNGSRYITVT